MSAATDRDRAIRLLQGLENGGMATAEARIVAQDLDPVLLHAVLRYLRQAYPVSEPAASAVLKRVVDLTSADPSIVKKSKEGERDPVAVWFAREHSFGAFRGRGRELIETIADKLDT